MAEAIVSLAVERISYLLIHEAVFLGGVRDEVERLKSELIRMQCFLKDADRKKEQDERLRNRVSEIKQLAYDAEDVIEGFILKVAHQGGFHVFTKPYHLYKIGKQVKAVQTKLGDISNSLQTYGISNEGERYSFSEMQSRLRRSYPHVEEEDLVSLEISTRDVLDQLMKEEDRLHDVVSIVGMGGIGKTTLAKQVYNHNDVKRHFDCCVWAFISQQCVRREVLQGILVKVLSPSEEGRELVDKFKEDELIERLHHFLKGKRYLIVLDDIWKTEDWDSLKPAFPKGNKGSKILFTTRNKDVALLADPCNSPIELPLLTNDESWKLFRRKAFPRHKTKWSNARSKEFEMLGKEMLKKCGGLPLAIVLLGGLLATKKSWNEWELALRNINAHLNKFQQQDYHYGGVNGILGLSYDELPFFLKPCFLYLGHYPEDWEISKKELIRLWIAEGFISTSFEGGDMLIEDVAEQYLEELINRCLVQVGRRDHTGTGVKTCRIHDLLRDLCLLKGQEENFLGIIQPPLIENDGHSLDVILTASMPRRIAIHPSKRYVCLKGKHPNLRSLLLFQNEELLKLNISECNDFKFLRVLNLVRNNISKWRVSSEIGNLHHLRYLGLKCSKNIILPQSTGKMKSLHTLIIRSDSVKIPNVLFLLERLRHILLPRWYDVMRYFPLDSLKNIETLKYIRVRNLDKNSPVLKLINIQNLGIRFKRSKDVEVILKSPVRLHRLQSLDMRLEDSTPYPDLEPLSQCHHLSKLLIKGKIQEDLYSSNHVLKFLPTNITKLTLYSCKISQDPMVVLEKLPCLRILHLWDESFMGARMSCSANGFPQLDFLYISSLSELEEWQIEEGAMPCLRFLRLDYVSKLWMIPEGLRYISTLKEMKLYGMKRSLVERIQVINKEEGEDFYKVQHIQSIQILGRTI
ncbi:hypothetical protein REPUB_Repub03eG0216500 [Reevesia pubescens]